MQSAYRYELLHKRRDQTGVAFGIALPLISARSWSRLPSRHTLMTNVTGESKFWERSTTSTSRGARTMWWVVMVYHSGRFLEYFKYGMEWSVEPIGSTFPVKMRMLEAKCLALLSLLASGASAANFLSTCKEIKRAISPASEVFYPGSCFHWFFPTELRTDANPR